MWGEGGMGDCTGRRCLLSEDSLNSSTESNV